MKVIIRNETAWQTRMLRPFVTRIAKEEFPGTKPGNTRRRVTVTIVYPRHSKQASYCSGEAYLNSSSACVRVPFPHPGRKFPVLDFCYVVGHEFAHCRGMQHPAMRWHYTRGAYTDAHYAWAKLLPVPLQKAAPRKPTTIEKREARLVAARKAVERWTRKRKLAETKLKLWQRKLRALGRALDTVRPPVAPLGCESGGDL